MKITIVLNLIAVSLITMSESRLMADPIQVLSVRNTEVAPCVSANGDSGSPILSPNGRFVLFASSADDLVAMTNGDRIASLIPLLNVYLHDRSNGVTTLVSVNLTGTNGGNGDSVPTGMSPDGRYVLFESSASDLVVGDTNSVSDVFVRDLLSGTTIPVSVSTNGDTGDGVSRSAVMTPDGHYVAFVSAANNLVPGDTNGIADVFLRDLQLETTILVSVGARASWSSLAFGSGSPDITPDGRYVAFYSLANNLVPGVTNAGEIYVRDVAAGTTAWVSAGALPALQLAQNATKAFSFGPAISTNGQFVTYEAFSYNSIVLPFTTGPGAGVILRYNVSSGLTDTINTNAALLDNSAEDAHNAVMTPDGRFVAFIANTNGAPDNCVLVWDAQTGTSVLASGDLTGTVPTNSMCDWPVISGKSYQVQFKNNLSDAVWQTLAGNVTIIGNQGYLYDLAPGASQRFYRILAQ